MDNWVKNTLQAFDDFKKKKKSVWSTVFWHVKVWIFRKYIQYTMHWVKAQILKKISLTKSTIQKIPSFFFRELQLITVLLLICDYYMSCSTRFVSLKLRVGFSIFNGNGISISISVLLKFIFLLNKMHGLFDFKTS